MNPKWKRLIPIALLPAMMVAAGSAGFANPPLAKLIASPTTLLSASPPIHLYVRSIEGSDPPDFNDATPLAGGFANESGGHLYGLEGRILRIDRNGTMVHSITVQVIHPLPTALGWQPYQEYGPEMTVRFDARVDDFDTLGISHDTTMSFYYGYMDNTPDWGSNLAWVCFWNDGECWRLDTKKGDD